jgi:ureidoacrylate peracid hydrolase
VYLRNHLSDALTPDSEWRNVALRAHGIDVLKSWREPNDILSYSEVIAPGPGEHEVLKQFYSGFFQTNLERLLRSLHTRTLVTVGFDSRICLASTATEAMYRDLRVIAVRDAIGTHPAITGDLHDAATSAASAVRYIETNVGYTVTSAQWIQACARALGPAS